MIRRRRHGVAVLSVILMAACILSVLGMIGAARESAARVAVTDAAAREVLDQAGRSAIEEAAASAENGVTPVMIPTTGPVPVMPALPTGVEPEATRAEFKDYHVEIKSPEMRWSQFTRQEVQLDDSTSVTRLIGIVEIKVALSARVVGRTVSRKLTVRRYATFEPDAPDASGGTTFAEQAGASTAVRGTLKITAVDLMMDMEER